jgi:hypothetical protein
MQFGDGKSIQERKREMSEALQDVTAVLDGEGK